MNGRPWIGIPTRRTQEKYHSQSRHYLEAVVDAGGVPVMIPSTGDLELTREYARRLDGVLLPGSPTDIDPAKFGEPPHPRLGRIYREREITDDILLELAEARSLPVLGICFGAQSLNVFRGGSLLQDIPSIVESALEHDQDRTAVADVLDAKLHSVRIDAGSRLAAIVGSTEVEVNSFHHQSVARPGRGLRVVARSTDGVIEAIEAIDAPFMVGVQWHPERGWQSDDVSRALFRKLIEEAGNRS